VVDFQEECTGCGACAESCPFLTEFGTPDEILAGHPELSFYCTSCRRCDAVCPLELSPAAAFFAAKERLVREGRIPATVRKALESARGFTKAGHGFPFSFYGTAPTVFWPGCGLAANSPGLVRRLREVLSCQLEIEIGLILDCCFDPVYEYGDTETTRAALRDIEKRLRDGNVTRVITGCLNCHKLLSQHLADIQVVFILEVLPPEMFEKKWNGPAYLHHPCPSSRWVGIRGAAHDLFRRLPKEGSPAEADPDGGRDLKVAPLAAAVSVGEVSEPRCCGAGGGLSSALPELAERFCDQIIVEGRERIMATYCVGCQNRFLKRGVEAVHLLECLPGVTPRRKISSPLGQWFNRLTLAVSERMKKGKLSFLLILGILIAVGFYLNKINFLSVETVVALLDLHPVLAPLIFIAIYAAAPALFLPSIPLTLAAGFFWGPVWGVVFSIMGATVGSCLPFFLARYLFQDAVKTKVPAARWAWLQDKVRHHGWKAVAFTRLIPVFPFNLLNYLFGLTPIPFFHYLWSTFVFMLPACIAFVAFGSSLGELIMRGNIRGVVLGVVIAVAAFLIPLVLKPYFRGVGKDGPTAEKGKNRPGGTMNE